MAKSQSSKMSNCIHTGSVGCGLGAVARLTSVGEVQGGKGLPVSFYGLLLRPPPRRKVHANSTPP